MRKSPSNPHNPCTGPCGKIRRAVLSVIFASLSVLFALAVAVFTGAPAYIAVLAPLTPALLLRTADKRVLALSTVLLLAASLYIPVFSPVLLSILMLLIPVYAALGRKECGNLLQALGFNGGIVRAAAFALASLIPAFIFMVLLAAVAPYLGFDDSHLVESKIMSLPTYILLYAITLGPLSEEIFFRAFLPRYTGGVLSSVLFGLAHYSYGSYIEVIGTFLLGLYLYALYRVSGDVKAPIIAHMLINAASLYALFGPLPGSG
ncbi:MAG: type II CAAX endopeptidase family protein [Candidatus Micrarchaeia archaeon]